MKHPEWIMETANQKAWRDPMGFLAQHSRSFRFAARFLPATQARQIAEVYAFCRMTDNLVDEAPGIGPEELEARLDDWEALARQAYIGGNTGLPILDAALGRMGRQGVPFHYAAELIEGMRMDVRPRLYKDLADLETYTYRVAGVVGQWLTELVGIQNPWVLERAADLGHGMQMTNILRDVGEDLQRGRVYLPLDALARHGLDAETFSSGWGGKSLPPKAYVQLMEELMAVAERHYRQAFQGIPSLPDFFQRPTLVAGLAYREIHAALRKNGHDNFRYRAHSTASGKFVIGMRALWLLPCIRHLFPATLAGERQLIPAQTQVHPASSPLEEAFAYGV